MDLLRVKDGAADESTFGVADLGLPVINFVDYLLLFGVWECEPFPCESC
jgi:hypothetical protein